MNFFHPTYIIAILIAISVHEWAHAMTAYRLGDDTAAMQGRLTLNPVSHIDPLGAILFLTIGFGWAKPVPINPLRMRNPKRDMALTALAGPVSNLGIAMIAFAILVAIEGTMPGLYGFLATPDSGQPILTIFLQILHASVFINLALMAFNLLPVPPLDGSNIVRIIIPWQWEERFDAYLRYGPFILLALIIAGQLGGFPLLSWWVGGIARVVLAVFGMVAGIFF